MASVEEKAASQNGVYKYPVPEKLPKPYDITYHDPKFLYVI